MTNRQLERTLDESKPVKPLSPEHARSSDRTRKLGRLQEEIYELLCRLDDLTPEDETERETLIAEVQAKRRERRETELETTR